jgi:hypothetical protein
VLRRDSHSLVLSPLQSRRICAESLELFREAAQVANQQQVLEWEQEPLRSRRLLRATWLAAIGIAAALVGVIGFASSRNSVLLAGATTVAVVCAVAGAYELGQGRPTDAVSAPVETANTAGEPAADENASTPPAGGDPERDIAWWMWAVPTVAVLAIALAVVAALLGWSTASVGASTVVAMLCGMSLAYAWGRKRKLDREIPPMRPQFSPAPVRGEPWDLIRDFIITTAYGAGLLLLVVIALAMPAAAIYFGTDMSQVLTLRAGHWPTVSSEPNSQRVIVGRGLQFVLLVVVSLVPALMFYQFDREKLSTLVDRWLHAIFRLDPSLKTVADVDAKYGRRVEEFYGATLGLGVVAARKRIRDRSPVLLATILIALGWIVVLLDQDSRASSRNPLASSTGFTFHLLFQSPPTPITLAYLGAYFLSVQLALRGYIRGDLKPKTYNVITVRILMAMVLALALQAIWGTTKVTLGLAFFAGILPNTTLRLLREVIPRGKDVPGIKQMISKMNGQPDPDDELSEKSPLSQLDDVDIYDRTRLEEEGITSVQALARHDLIDLILSSRIPVPRLIDWLDQAVLHQHARAALSDLRDLGIRTATDYLEVCADRKAHRELHEAAAAEDWGSKVRLDLLRVVLAGDEWVKYLQNWRASDGTSRPVTKTYDVNGSRSRAIAGNLNGHGRGTHDGDSAAARNILLSQ